MPTYSVTVTRRVEHTQEVVLEIDTDDQYDAEREAEQQAEFLPETRWVTTETEVIEDPTADDCERLDGDDDEDDDWDDDDDADGDDNHGVNGCPFPEDTRD